MQRVLWATSAMTCSFLASIALSAQPPSLQLNTAIDRNIGPKEVHEYTVQARKNQRFTVTVQQRGVDVVVLVIGPDGKELARVDSAFEDSGMGGSEVAHVEALSAGEYHVRIMPFERDDAKAGAYAVTLSDMRPLTAAELTAAKAAAEIMAVEDEWEDAVNQRDTTRMGKILRNDGMALSMDGNAVLAAQHLASFDESRKQMEAVGGSSEHTLSQRVIKVFGNTAVSSGRSLIVTKVKGEHRSSLSGRFVHVWAKDASGWKMVADHFYRYGRPPREKSAPVSVDSSALTAYAGTYRPEHNSAQTLTISVENDTLTAQWATPSQTFPKARLVPLRDGTFAAPADNEMTFVRSADGQVREIVLVGDGPSTRAFRVDEAGSKD